MDAPSSTSEPIVRRHTLASARAALPLLRSIARDVHATYVRLQARLRALDEHRPLEQLSAEAELPEELTGELAELHAHIAELHALGARPGDPELGVVLLDAIVGDRPGTLCWKVGEATIRYWYPLGERYEDRRPVPSA